MTVETTEQRLESIREQLASPWTEHEERVVETAAIPIAVEKRGHWYHLKDRGEAIARARTLGAPGDWLAIAERVVAEEGFNVNRSGVVFVSVTEGRDVANILLRVSDCAERVQAALLDAA
jgi:hypothetical protein